MKFQWIGMTEIAVAALRGGRWHRAQLTPYEVSPLVENCCVESGRRVGCLGDRRARVVAR
jgi:hypothetical protein